MNLVSTNNGVVFVERRSEDTFELRIGWGEKRDRRVFLTRAQVRRVAIKLLLETDPFDEPKGKR